MIEPRAMARELQEQLTDAVKASQEQFRKGQETAASAVRTWTETARSVRTHLPKPTLPAAQLPKLPAVSLPTLADVREAGAKLREVTLKDVKLPEVRLPKLPVQRLNRIASTDELAEGAERLANRVLVTQLKLAGRTLHNAAPVIADGAAFLTRAADRVASRVQPATETQADKVAEIADVVELAPATQATAKASTTKASPAKPRATKASTARTSTAKAAAAKAPAKASSTARKAKTTKK